MSQQDHPVCVLPEDMENEPVEQLPQVFTQVNNSYLTGIDPSMIQYPSYVVYVPYPIDNCQDIVTSVISCTNTQSIPYAPIFDQCCLTNTQPEQDEVSQQKTIRQKSDKFYVVQYFFMIRLLTWLGYNVKLNNPKKKANKSWYQLWKVKSINKDGIEFFNYESKKNETKEKYAYCNKDRNLKNVMDIITLREMIEIAKSNENAEVHSKDGKKSSHHIPTKKVILSASFNQAVYDKEDIINTGDATFNLLNLINDGEVNVNSDLFNKLQGIQAEQNVLNNC